MANPKKQVPFTSMFPSCTVVMKRTNLIGYKLRLPARFYEHMTFEKTGKVVFEEQKTGKQWIVSYFDENIGGKPRVVFSGGWMFFSKDNHLRIGDTCGFEFLPHRRDTTIRVSIFPNDRAPSPPSSNVASHHRAQKRRLLFKPKTSRFFKIVLPDAVDRGRLAIPSTFARKHRNIPNQVFLKVPSGAAWKVELVKRGNGFWLQDGWRAFQEYYSISHGAFLLFEYNGGSCFDVSIFDTNAFEIAYPYDDDYEEPMFWSTSNKRKRDDNANVEILDECLPSSKKSGKSPLPDPQPSMVGRTNFSSNRKNNSKLHTSSSAKRDNEGVSSNKHGKKRISKNMKLLGETRTSKTQQRLMNSLNKSGGFKDAVGFKSENPSCVVVIRPTYVGGRFMWMPFRFASNHLKPVSGNVILHISKTKTWQVAYKIYSEHKTAQLTSGWSAFVADNKLEAGDECAFELINPAERRLKVVIVRAGTEKIAKLPKRKEKHPCSKAKATIKLESSAPELQTYVSPVAAQSIRIKTENFT